ETYNIAITSSNRVFLTGTIMFGEPLQALTALEITDEFDLEEGEVFLPQDTNVYLEYIQNEVIFTNLHRFGLSAFFGPADESLVPDKLYLNLSLILGEDDEALFVYYSTRGSFAYIVTINGSIIIWSHDNQITAQMELQPDEILLSHVMGLYFTTNKGRVLFANAAEVNEIIIHDISEDFNIGTNIVQCYVNLNYNEGMNYAILVGENEDIYRVTYDQTTMQFVFENLTAKLKGFGTGEIITVAGTEGLYTYYVADGAFFALYNINIEPLFIPVLKPVVKEYILNEEVTLEDYHHDKYAIIGWTDFDSDREYDETLTLDKDITLIPNFAGYVSIYIDSGYYSYQMNVLEGEVLTRQEIIDKADVPYGMVIADIVDQYGDSFTEQVIWEEDFLNLVLDYADGHFVGLVIVNSDKDILEYKDIFVMDGDSLANPNIEFNIPENINVIGYYQDADLLTPYILDQEVSEDLIIYLCIEEAQKFKVTLNLPGSDKIIYEVLEKSGVDIYELRRLIHIENYALDGIFYDPEFTQVFDYEQVKADLDLYVKLLWERYVRIEFYLYGNLMKVLYEKLTEGGSPADIKMNDLFVLDGVYLDSDFTQQVFTFTDSNVSTLYAQVSQVPGYNLQIIFPEYQELNYQLNNFRGGYFNLRDLINNNLSNHSTSYQIGFDLYFDAEMQNQVEYDIEFYDNMTLYVDIRDELVSIMFVGEDVTIHAYHCAGQDFDISNIYRLLAYYDESKNWQIYGTYNDPTYLNEYQYGTPIYSPITLYIQLSSNDFAEISVTIVGWNINFNIYQEEMGLYQYLIFNRLQEIGFAPSEFDYAIYTDEECTTPYDYHTVSDGEHLYIQVTPRNQVRLIIEFPELDIPPLVIYLNQGDQYYSYLVSEYLQDYYFGFSISVYVYLDDTFQTPFSGLVDQNLTVYADADIRPMIYVRIFAPFTGLDGQTFGLEAGQSISIQTIEETGQFVNVNGIYLDPECTVPYTATPIMETTCLFIKISN
ncbi:MAG: hypothetical protein GX661_04545, partial [Acholeplasmataceae bacterium]|nr:hypothetical protein [Acholeplasmataceae bacterium]